MGTTPDQRGHPRPLDRLGPTPAGVERDMGTVERGLLLGPQCLHAQHVLTCDLAAHPELHPVICRLRPVPPEADAEDHPSSAEMIECGDLLGQHDPIVLAKQVATLDHLSGGRVVLGIGFGWNRAEAADHGVEFRMRREVAREHVLCMQALWTEEQAAFHGAHVSLDPCWSWPKPIQRPRVTTLVGGGAHPSVFAAVAEYADGWMPIGGSGLAVALSELRRAVEARGRDPEDVRVVPFGTVPTDQKLAHYQELGIGEVVLRVPSGASAQMLPVLDGLVPFVERFGDDGD